MPPPIVVTLTTDKVYHRPGEAVVMTMTVRNVGLEPILLQFGSSQRFDFFVRHVPSNEVVWQWSFGRQFLWVMGGETLEPGETRIFKEEWKQVNNANAKVPTGLYKLEGVVTSYEPAALLSNPAFIQIARRLF
jgi:hypothetical protein